MCCGGVTIFFQIPETEIIFSRSLWKCDSPNFTDHFRPLEIFPDACIFLMCIHCQIPNIALHRIKHLS